MVAPLIPIAIGLGMAAGGGAAFGRGMRVSGTGPRRVYYGGSRPEYEAQRNVYQAGVSGASGQMQAGTTGLQGIGAWGDAEMNARGADINTALGGEAQARKLQMQQMDALTRAAGSYVPGQQSKAQMELALQRNATQSMAMARGDANEAMGLRNALNANAQAGVDAAAQLAAIRAQEEQAAVGMRMQAAGQAGQMAASMRGGDQALAGFQAGRQQFGVQSAGDVYGGLMGLGASREGAYLSAQQQMELAQLQAQMDYEQRRQADRQQKRSMLTGLGAGLIGAGGQVMSSGFGGGK